MEIPIVTDKKTAAMTTTASIILIIRIVVSTDSVNRKKMSVSNEHSLLLPTSDSHSVEDPHVPNKRKVIKLREWISPHIPNQNTGPPSIICIIYLCTQGWGLIEPPFGFEFCVYISLWLA